MEERKKKKNNRNAKKICINNCCHWAQEKTAFSWKGKSSMSGKSHFKILCVPFHLLFYNNYEWKTLYETIKTTKKYKDELIKMNEKREEKKKSFHLIVSVRLLNVPIWGWIMRARLKHKNGNLLWQQKK